VRLLVIEHFTGERRQRQQVWDGLNKKFNRQLEIHFCGQEKDQNFLREADGTPFHIEEYDLVFIHSGDKQYSPSENYVDLAKINNKAFACYSGGADSVNAPNLHDLQIEEMPLELFRKQIGAFLERLAHDGQITPEAFYILADFNPKLEATYNLLQMFLPLDLWLQTRDVDECKTQAVLLLKNKDQTAALLSQVIGGPPLSPDRIEDTHLEDDGPPGLLSRLWACAEKLQAANDVSRLNEVFGYAFGESILRDSVAASSGLQEKGFHMTYEKFRDELFRLTLRDE
jgi:hypothetical protein